MGALFFPYISKEFGLLQNPPGGDGLLVGWIAILCERALHHHSKTRLDILADSPVNRRATAHLLDQHPSQLAELLVLEHHASALIIGECIIEGYLIVGEPKLHATRVCLSDFFCERDELLYHFGRSKEVVLVLLDGPIEHDRELPALYGVLAQPQDYLVIEHLLEQLHCQISMLHSLHLRQELIREHREVGLLHARRGEDVHNTFSNKRLVYDLPNSRADVLRPWCTLWLELHEPRLDSLEEPALIAYFHSGGARHGERERMGEAHHLSNETLLAILFLLLLAGRARFSPGFIKREDMLLRLQNDAELLVGVGREVPVIIKVVEHLLHYFVLLNHHLDGLLLCDSRVALAPALRIGGERLLQVSSEADVVHNKATGLVLVDAIHPRDGLHEIVPTHEFVYVHRVEARHIKAGKPHVADDNHLERATRILEAVGELPTI